MSKLAQKIVGKTIKRVKLSAHNDDYQPQIELWFTDGSYFCAMRELKKNPSISVSFAPSDEADISSEDIMLRNS